MDELKQWEREEEYAFDAELLQALIRKGAETGALHLAWEEMHWLTTVLWRVHALSCYDVSPYGGPLYLQSPMGPVKVTYE